MVTAPGRAAEDRAVVAHGHDGAARRPVQPTLTHGGFGVGRALGEHVLAAARAAGFRGMQFNAVVETNTVAVRLWRSLGLEVL